MRRLTEQEREALDMDDPDLLILPGIGIRRVGGLPDELPNLIGVYVQASRTASKDGSRSTIGAPVPVSKSECKCATHLGERVLPVAKFSPDPARPNGLDHYCKACRRRAATLRRKSKKARSTSAAAQDS